MKAKYKLFVLLSTILPLAITGCSDDEDTTPTVEVPELGIAEKEIKVKIGNDASVDITQGGGEYKTFSLDEKVATAQLTNNKLSIQGLKIGKTSLIISDNDNCYQRLAISVYQYDAVKVSKQEVALKFHQGHSKSMTVDILEGNGNYTVSSDNKIAKASVTDNQITINATGKGGVANITVTDASGFQVVIRVETTTSIIPYEAAELEAMKQDATLRYNFNGKTKNNVGAYYDLLNQKEGELNLYGWDYYNYNYLKIYFAGDKEVGTKAGSKLTYNESELSLSDEPIKFEIIKNDRTKIWATYSFIKDEKLYFGHFCQNINP